MRLGERLKTIAKLVEFGSRLADIGTDHAYLPIYLIQNGIISLAVAGEVNKGPFKAAQEAIERLDLSSKISLRLGNGLSVVSPGEVDTAVIAGMGATTIIGILQEQPQVVVSLRRLIIQPMVAAPLVRRWLTSNGWKLVEEKLVIDDGKLYEIIAAERGDSPEFEPVLYEIGPILWKDRSPLLEVHIDQLIGQAKRIINEMMTGNDFEDSPKYAEYVEKLRQLEAQKTCL